MNDNTTLEKPAFVELLHKAFTRLMYKFPGLNTQLKQRRVQHFYSAFIQPNELCFDAGANVGARTAPLLALGAKVVAIEPQEQCIKILHSKFDNNPRFFLESKGLGACVGERTFFVSNVSEVSTFSEAFIAEYSRMEKLEWNKKVQVQMTSLDVLIQLYGIPKFCKVDVEGFEEEVFRGLSKPIPFIAFEYNEPFRKETLICIDLLAKLGNYEFNFSPYERMHLTLDHWIPPQDFEVYISTLDRTILTGEVYARIC